MRVLMSLLEGRGRGKGGGGRAGLRRRGGIGMLVGRRNLTELRVEERRNSREDRRTIRYSSLPPDIPSPPLLPPLHPNSILIPTTPTTRMTTPATYSEEEEDDRRRSPECSKDYSAENQRKIDSSSREKQGEIRDTDRRRSSMGMNSNGRLMGVGMLVRSRRVGRRFERRRRRRWCDRREGAGEMGWIILSDLITHEGGRKEGGV